MIPKLTFEVIDNPDGMIRIINNFLLNKNRSGFDWSKTYSKKYPRLGKLIKKAKNQEEIKQISTNFFKDLYNNNTEKLERVSKKFQKEWNKKGEKILSILSEVIEIKWPEDCKEMKSWISLNPICPRFIKQRSFDLYWRFSLKEMKETSLHEILHFIWFEKWKEVFPNYNEKEFESPHLIWKLSEIVPLAVLNDKRIQKIFKHKPSVYREWWIKRINGKPLLNHIQEIYDNKKSFADFMKKSWDFVKAHRKELE